MSKIQKTIKLKTINNWIVLHLPERVSSPLPSRGITLVEGTINAQPVLLVLEPDGKGGHWCRLDDKYNIQYPETVDVNLTPSKNWPEPELPVDLANTLEKFPDAMELWQNITPLSRWDWIRWIRSTKNPATRQNRIDSTIDKLQKGERRPCCFNRNLCTEPHVSHRGVLLNLSN